VNDAAGDDGGGDTPRLLLLCDYRPDEASTVLDHIHAIRRWSRSAVYVLPMLGDIPDGLDLEAFDGLIIHYNITMADNAYLSPLARWRIRQYSGTKGAFIQDEYRSVSNTVSVIDSLGIEILFNCVPTEEVHKVYALDLLPRLRRVVNVLTGYVPDALLAIDIPAYGERRIDVGYRGRRLPAWLGELAQEKVRIADRFAADAAHHHVSTDISCDESDRLYGSAWYSFIASCKAMLGVESGASVFDFDGSIEADVRRHLAAHPRTQFAELQRLYFADSEGRIRLNQISPRSFEAAALGTLMVMYPGEYSGILQPWRHYVPLERDHSNMAQVVEVIRDQRRWTEITGWARDEVALNPSYSYQAMVDSVDDAMALRATGRARTGAAAFARLASRSFADMPNTKRHRPGVSPSLNRLGLLVARVAHLVTTSATGIAPSAAHRAERLHHLQSLALRLGAFVYWASRRSLVTIGDLVRGGRPLLEDLAELRELQVVGQRATATVGSSPYAIVLERERGALRIVTRSAGPSSDGIAALPDDTSWAKWLELDLDDRWVVPIDRPEGLHRRLDALSVVLTRRPKAGRRLIAGDGPWCEFLPAQASA
jgi:hypothetical protein